MREYQTIRALHEGETVVLNGKHYRKDGNGQVNIGDWYIAERNTGPVLLKAAGISPRGWIVSTCFNAYSYDVCECVRIIQVPSGG